MTNDVDILKTAPVEFDPNLDRSVASLWAQYGGRLVTCGVVHTAKLAMAGFESPDVDFAGNGTCAAIGFTDLSVGEGGWVYGRPIAGVGAMQTEKTEGSVQVPVYGKVPRQVTTLVGYEVTQRWIQIPSGLPGTVKVHIVTPERWLKDFAPHVNNSIYNPSTGIVTGVPIYRTDTVYDTVITGYETRPDSYSLDVGNQRAVAGLKYLSGLMPWFGGAEISAEAGIPVWRKGWAAAAKHVVYTAGAGTVRAVAVRENGNVVTPDDFGAGEFLAEDWIVGGIPEPINVGTLRLPAEGFGFVVLAPLPASSGDGDGTGGGGNTGTSPLHLYNADTRGTVQAYARGTSPNELRIEVAPLPPK